MSKVKPVCSGDVVSVDHAETLLDHKRAAQCAGLLCSGHLPTSLRFRSRRAAPRLWEEPRLPSSGCGRVHPLPVVLVPVCPTSTLTAALLYYSVLVTTPYCLELLTTRTCCQSEGTDPLCPNVQLPGGPGRVIAGSKTPLPRVPAPAAGLSSGRSTARHQTCRLTLCLPGFCELWAPRMLAEYHSFLSRAIIQHAPVQNRRPSLS